MRQVVNKKKHSATKNDVYIGRGSALGNPFTHRLGTTALYKVETRSEAIEAYKDHLRQQIKQNNVEFVEALREIFRNPDAVLVCYCKPKACHGDFILEFIEGLEERGKHNKFIREIKNMTVEECETLVENSNGCKNIFGEVEW